MVISPGRKSAMDLVMLNITSTGFMFEVLHVVTEYPANCTKYYGPHETECLVTIWFGAKCSQKGYKYPDNLTAAEHEYMDDLNLRYCSQVGLPEYIV